VADRLDIIMNPLLHQAAMSAFHNPDAQIREGVLQALELLEQVPQHLERWQSSLVQNQSLAQCLQIDPEQIAESRWLATKLCDDGDFLLALPLAMYCASYASDHAEHSFLAGACLQRLGQPALALHFYRVALQLNEADAASAYRLGECLEAVGQLEEASHLYNWAIELARGDFALRALQDRASERLAQLVTALRP
jgi:tetratricopeptide (TPR) repeat protein